MKNIENLIAYQKSELEKLAHFQDDCDLIFNFMSTCSNKFVKVSEILLNELKKNKKLMVMYSEQIKANEKSIKKGDKEPPFIIHSKKGTEIIQPKLRL